MDGAVGSESGTDLSEGFGSHALADTVVGGDCDGFFFFGLGVGVLDGDGDDFLVEEALDLGFFGLLVGRGCEGVLLGTGDVAGLGHVFGEDTHGDLAVCGLHVVLEELRELGNGSGAVYMLVYVELTLTDGEIEEGKGQLLTRTAGTCSRHQHRYQHQ